MWIAWKTVTSLDAVLETTTETVVKTVTSVEIVAQRSPQKSRVLQQSAGWYPAPSPGKSLFLSAVHTTVSTKLTGFTGRHAAFRSI